MCYEFASAYAFYSKLAERKVTHENAYVAIWFSSSIKLNLLYTKRISFNNLLSYYVYSYSCHRSVTLLISIASVFWSSS